MPESAGAEREFVAFARTAMPPTGVRFLPPGDRVATLTFFRLELWDAAHGAAIGVVQLPRDSEVTDAWAITPVGDHLLVGIEGGGLRRLDFAGCEVRRFQLDAAAAAYFSAEDPGLGTRVSRLDPPTDLSPAAPCEQGGQVGTPLNGTWTDLSEAYPPYATACALDFAPDARHFVAAYGQAYALVWDVASGALTGVLGGGPASARPPRIYRAVWSPDGAHLLTADDQGGLRCWVAATGRELWRRRVAATAGAERPDYSSSGFCGGVGAIAFAAEPAGEHETGDPVLVYAASGPRVRRWTRSGHELPPLVGHGTEHPMLGETEGAPAIADIRVSVDGRRVLTVGRDATLRVWDAARGREVWWETPEPCCGDYGDLSPDGRRVAWAACPGARVYHVE